MKEELHLFIIWENGRYKQNDILADIEENFEIIKLLEIEWSKEEFSNNLSRFYGTNLPKGSHKEIHCGIGKFLLIIIKYREPLYEEITTSRGKEIVNVNIFDRKEKYRKWTGGGHKIHATNNEIETNHDITLLLGRNIEDFVKENKCKSADMCVEKVSRDLFGAKEWNSVEEMFYALNNCTNYAILRNYECLPNEIYENNHNDIDLICESLEDVAYILNASPTCIESYRVQYKTNVNGRVAYFDLRNIGDNYYYKDLEIDILKNRIYNENGFFTLNDEDYFYTLLYHALIHKPEFKEDYKEKLINLNIENINRDTNINEYIHILKKWMINNEYIIVVPDDETVMLNQENSEQLYPLVYRKSDILELKKLKKENNELTEEIKRLNSIICNIECSKSWKIIEKFRNLKKIFK